MNFFKNLQEKPQPIKIKILWIAVVLSVSLIFVVWLLVLLPYNLSKIQSEELFKEDNNKFMPEKFKFKNLEGQLSEFKDLLESQEKKSYPQQIEEELKEELLFEENYYKKEGDSYIRKEEIQPHLKLEDKE